MSSCASPLPAAPPWLIQGGMGISISSWPLARAVARAGQLGVVSGTSLDSVFARRLQDSGVSDALRKVLERFPLQSVVRDVLAKYATTRHGAAKTLFRPVPMATHRQSEASQDLMVLAAYAEVAQAKEGHDGAVGINLLTKVQIPTVPTLFGAMLAGVDYVLMGAGIPSHIPGVLHRLAEGELVATPLEVEGDARGHRLPTLRFNPRRWLAGSTLARPKFLAIVSSHVLATALARRSNGVVDGFVVESPVAGGHNAPPRGALTLDAEGEPIYGERDRADLSVMRELGAPFWIAGGVNTREDVRAAMDQGAAGVQVGSLFAYCRESGMAEGLKAAVAARARRGTLRVRTSARVSPTGYPFKVVELDGTLSDPEVYAARERVCDLGYLRDAYVRPDGSVGYRCPSEPVEAYLEKGGSLAETEGRVCLCNALMATAGLGQVRRGVAEPPIVTSGDYAGSIAPLLGDDGDYGAADVIAHLQP